MTWQNSLVRLADYEVEQLRKRLADVTDRRVAADVRLAKLYAEAKQERQRASADTDAGWCWPAYQRGWKIRRDRFEADIAALASEEAGARDALAEAFEELKKFEQVEEMALDKARKLEAKRESAEFDELALRRASRR